MRILMGIAAGGLVALGATVGLAQENGAGSIERRNYEVSGFDEISMVGPHHVIVSVGDGFSVSADGPRETLEHTEVVVDGDRLKIQPREDDPWWEQQWNGNRRDYQAATYRVTLPRLAAAALAGSGDIRIERVEGENFSASVAGSGLLDVAALRVEEARFSVAGSGDLTARGSARRSRVSVAGSGNLRARDVSSVTASVSVAGSGNAALTVADDAHVSIVGSGDVDITGSASCSVSRIGSGRVTCNGVAQENRRS